MAKLFVSSLKMLYRDKQALFWAMAFPVIFAIVFGLFDFNDAPELRFSVVSEQPSPVAQRLVEGLERVESFEVSETEDPAAARARLEDGEVDLVMVVPEVTQGTGSRPTGSSTMEVLYNGGSAQEAQVGLDAIGRIVQGMNLELAGVSTPPIQMRQQPLAGKTVDYYDFLLPGLVAMGVMNFSIIGMAVAVARFREQRILKRILATPLRPVKFLAAQVAARLILSICQAALILAVGVFGFGAHVYGNVLWIFVLAMLANLIFLNFGFAVAGRSSNPDAAQGTANAVALPMMFLSGVFFPTDTLPEVMQVVVRFLPLTPLIEAMRTVSVDGESISSAGSQVVLLVVWVALSFVIAGTQFRFSEGPRRSGGLVRAAGRARDRGPEPVDA